MNAWMILVGLIWMHPPIKQEIETSIHKRDMPAAAMAFISTSLANATHIRYFRETDGQKLSFEVKFRLDGRHWSVEFDPSGTLEDAELLVRMEDLSQEWTTKMNSHLNSRFTSWTANRIQLQFLSWPANLDDPSGVELIIEGQNSSELGVFEIFIPTDNSPISERRVLEILDF